MLIQYSRNFLSIYGVIYLAALNSASKLNSPIEKAGNMTGILPFGTEEIQRKTSGVMSNQGNQEKTADISNKAGDEQSGFEKELSVYNIESVDHTHGHVYYTVFNSKGVYVTVISRHRAQNIEIRGKRVYVNGRLVCPNVIMLARSKLAYQKRRDGSMWCTNLMVGSPMTEEEITNFKEEEAELEKETYEEEAAAETMKEKKSNMENEELVMMSNKQEKEVLESTQKPRKKTFRDLRRIRGEALSAELRETALKMDETEKELSVRRWAKALKKAEECRNSALKANEEETNKTDDQIMILLESAAKSRAEALATGKRRKEEKLRQWVRTFEADEKYKEGALKEAQKDKEQALKVADVQSKMAAEQRARVLALYEENSKAALKAAEKTGENAVQQTKKALEATMKALEERMMSDEKRREEAAEQRLNELEALVNRREEDLQNATRSWEDKLKQADRESEVCAEEEVREIDEVGKNTLELLEASKRGRERVLEWRMKEFTADEEHLKNALAQAMRAREMVSEQRKKASEAVVTTRKNVRLAEERLEKTAVQTQKTKTDMTPGNALGKESEGRAIKNEDTLQQATKSQEDKQEAKEAEATEKNMQELFETSKKGSRRVAEQKLKKFIVDKEHLENALEEAERIGEMVIAHRNKKTEAAVVPKKNVKLAQKPLEKAAGQAQRTKTDVTQRDKA